MKGERKRAEMNNVRMSAGCIHPFSCLLLELIGGAA